MPENASDYENQNTNKIVGFEHGVIKVFGVGGGGGNTVDHMIQQGMNGVDLISVNTDLQALAANLAPNKIQIGEYISKGLGSGADPEIGKMAAQESRTIIKKALDGSDMIFITAGMGGGTGTGAAGFIAEVAKEMGIVTVGIVTTPFGFEGKKRSAVAREGLKYLQQNVNSLIVIPNDRLKTALGSNTTLLDAFKKANDVLYGAIYSITGIIQFPGHINVDFADVCTVMQFPGVAMMGTGVASGEDRANNAVVKAISCELLEDINLENAKGLLVCVTASENISLGEFSEIGDLVSSIANEDALVIIGTSIDPNMVDNIGVTIVATGFEGDITKEKLTHTISGAKIAS